MPTRITGLTPVSKNLADPGFLTAGAAAVVTNAPAAIGGKTTIRLITLHNTDVAPRTATIWLVAAVAGAVGVAANSNRIYLQDLAANETVFLPLDPGYILAAPNDSLQAAGAVADVIVCTVSGYEDE